MLLPKNIVNKTGKLLLPAAPFTLFSAILYSITDVVSMKKHFLTI